MSTSDDTNQLPETVGAEASRSARSSTRLKWVLVRLALVSSVSLLTFLLAEVSYRGWLRSQGEAYDALLIYTSLVQHTRPMEAFTPRGTSPDAKEHGSCSLTPYYGAEMEHDTGGVLTYFREQPPIDDYKVVVVGGSVAAGWGFDHQKYFKQLLQADPRLEGRNVKILCFAHAAHKQPQQLNRIALLFSMGYFPDAVINLDGFNETALAMQNARGGANPVCPSAPVWSAVLMHRRANDRNVIESMAKLYLLKLEAESIIDRANSLHFFETSLLGRFTASRIARINQERKVIREELNKNFDRSLFQYRRSPECVGPPFSRDTEAIVDLSTRIWFESSLSLHALCESRGVIYIHCLQPALCDEGSKPMSNAERKLEGPPAWTEGVVLGYSRLRALGEQLVERGVHFADTSDCFADVEKTLYQDLCHFGQLGKRLISDRIAPEFLSRAFAEGRPSDGVPTAPGSSGGAQQSQED